MYQLISTSYQNDDGPAVVLYGRGQSGDLKRVVVRNFLPYFYVLPKNWDNVIMMLADFNEIVKVEVEHKFLPIGYQSEKTDVLKIFVRFPGDVPKLRDHFRDSPDIIDVYEADILYATARFLTDYDLCGMGWFEEKDGNIYPVEFDGNAPIRTMGFDIEVLPPERGAPTAINDPIIIISMSFNIAYEGMSNLVLVARNGESCSNVVYCCNEYNMLRKFLDVIQNYDPDVILGFNSHMFDFPYISKRLEVLEIYDTVGRDKSPMKIKEFSGHKEIEIVGRVSIDLLNIIKINYSLSSYSLENVAKSLLKRSKLDIKASHMRKIWNDNSPEEMKKFIEYAARDADLLQDIVNVLKILDRYIELSKECGLLLHETVNAGQTKRIESMLLREFRKSDRLFPLKPREISEDVVEGAIVLDPVRGLHENIIVMDYKSLYPSAIRAFNICWSTILDDNGPACNFITSPNNIKYCDHSVYEGIMPRILTKLYNKRVELKALMKKATSDSERELYNNQQYSVKILLNSFYGYTGASNSRFYDSRLANSVTSVGRMVIKMTKDTTEKLIKCEVIGGDTDSIFIKLYDVDGPDDARKIAANIHNEMMKKLPPPMEIDFECFAKRAIIFEKKRYAMWIFEESNEGWKESYKYRGIELRRKDWIPLVGETMQYVLETILKDNDIEGAWKYTNKVLEEVKKLSNINNNSELASKMILSRKIGDVDRYKVIQPHVVLYNKIVERGEQPPGLGDRIQYYAIPGALKNGISYYVETPEWVSKHGGRIDNNWYIEKQLVPPLKRVFDAVGFDISTGKKKAHATDLFKFVLKLGEIK